MQIKADGERVTVAIKATCLDDWEYWLDAIGAPRNVRTRTAGHAQVAAGTLDGVAVHLTAHGVPELLQEASDTAADPFFLWGRIYDLGMGQVDRADRIWLSLGRRQDERGMPLLVLRGTDGPPIRSPRSSWRTARWRRPPCPPAEWPGTALDRSRGAASADCFSLVTHAPLHEVNRGDVSTYAHSPCTAPGAERPWPVVGEVARYGWFPTLPTVRRKGADGAHRP